MAAEHKVVDYGTYMGAKIVKHLDIVNSVIKRKFFCVSDKETDFVSCTETFEEAKKKIEEHKRIYEDTMKQGSVIKYVIYEGIAETLKKDSIKEGISFNGICSIEKNMIETYKTKEEALKNLKNLKTKEEKTKTLDGKTAYRIIEYAVIEEYHSKWTEWKEEIAIISYSKNNFKKMEVKKHEKTIH